jgi:hypothetical protein
LSSFRFAAARPSTTSGSDVFSFTKCLLLARLYAEQPR